MYDPANGDGKLNVPLKKDFFVGSTAKDYKLDKPCFEKL